jgi:chromate reductase
MSRPYGDAAWKEKPVFVASASGGALAGALANYSLRQSLAFVNAYVPGQPEFFLGHANTKFDEAGNLTDEDTKKHIDGAFAAFTAYIDKFK